MCRLSDRQFISLLRDTERPMASIYVERHGKAYWDKRSGGNSTCRGGRFPSLCYLHVRLNRSGKRCADYAEQLVESSFLAREDVCCDICGPRKSALKYRFRRSCVGGVALSRSRSQCLLRV